MFSVIIVIRESKLAEETANFLVVKHSVQVNEFLVNKVFTVTLYIYIYIYGVWTLPRHILCCELLQT